jgi:hypothetical protein
MIVKIRATMAACFIELPGTSTTSPSTSSKRIPGASGSFQNSSALIVAWTVDAIVGSNQDWLNRMEDAARCSFYAGPLDPRHPAAVAHADWIIDLGPGAGHDGGRIMFEGTPADLVAARSTLTGEHLAAYVGA